MNPRSAARFENSGHGSSAQDLPDFAEAVLAVVDQIPAGMVLAYGDVAELLGHGGPRQVGSVMSRYGSSVTWWRVTRASGEAPRGLLDEAMARWRAEGTALVRGALAGRRVDMTRARWDGEAALGALTEASTGETVNIILDEVDSR
jgi:alkylated DNA nucleotide flippase Atl1